MSARGPEALGHQGLVVVGRGPLGAMLLEALGHQGRGAIGRGPLLQHRNMENGKKICDLYSNSSLIHSCQVGVWNQQNL